MDNNMDTTTLTPSQKAEVEAISFDEVWDKNPNIQFRLSIRNCADGASLVTLTTNFEPGNRQQYMDVESLACSLLSRISRTKPGSTWGSTSDGIGGHVALESGQFVYNKSGCRKLTCLAIARRHNIGIGRL